MSAGGSLSVRARDALRMVAALILALAGTISVDSAGLGYHQADGDAAGIRIVHGLADAGPLDIYVDGSIALIGIVFGETSGALNLTGGEHQFSVAPSGAPPDDALVAGSLSLNAGTTSYATLFGTAEATSVGLFTISKRPLEQARARFRVISGVVDIEEIVPAFAGGDALTQPLGFGDASEYAAIDAGAYDIDLLDAATGAPLLVLPGLELAEGTTTDIILIGQAADGSLAALLETTPVETTRPAGLLARIVGGSCADPGALVADLGVVRSGQGEPVGVANVPPVAQGYGLAPASFTTLVTTPHAIVVSGEEGTTSTFVACGAIGGQLTDTGSLVVALEAGGATGANGIAVLAPGLDDPETTGVSVFLTGGTVTSSPAAATPTTVNG